jgi:hypothetical protein
MIKRLERLKILLINIWPTYDQIDLDLSLRTEVGRKLTTKCISCHLEPSERHTSHIPPISNTNTAASWVVLFYSILLHIHIIVLFLLVLSGTQIAVKEKWVISSSQNFLLFNEKVLLTDSHKKVIIIIIIYSQNILQSVLSMSQGQVLSLSLIM